MSNELNHKLYYYQATPPSKTWEQIASALDHQTSSLSDKLYNYKQSPRIGIWKNIEEVLDGNTINRNAVILPFYQRFKQPLKYGAAAAVLILLATAITLFLNRSHTTNEVAVQPVIIQKVTDPTESTDQKINADPTETVQPRDESKETVMVHPQNPERLPLKEQGKQKANRYVMMASEDGNKVRLSKKAFTVFNCAENTTSLNYERCKENILLMQRKMSVSLLSPSGDFSGLIDMIKSLEEND